MSLGEDSAQPDSWIKLPGKEKGPKGEPVVSNAVLYVSRVGEFHTPVTLTLRTDAISTLEPYYAFPRTPFPRTPFPRVPSPRTQRSTEAKHERR